MSLASSLDTGNVCNDICLHGGMLSQAPLLVAYDLIKMDWWVCPVKPGDKSPLTPHGFKDASNEHEQLEIWRQEWPDANIGIDCGRSGLMVCDSFFKYKKIDSREVMY